MKIIGFIFGIIGIALLGLGGYLFVRAQIFLQGAELTTAVVTDNKLYEYTGQVNEYGVQHYYCSEFQFQTRDGRSVSFEETDCAQLDSPPNYQIGDKVDVYYDPRDPNQTVILQKDQYANTIGAIGFGTLSLLLGLLLFWGGVRRSRSAAAT